MKMVKIQRTWLGGKNIDAAKFIDQITAIDPAQHLNIGEGAIKKRKQPLISSPNNEDAF